MWRNVEVAEFVTLLREYNDALAGATPKVGFYGLDLYSLHRSMEAVIEYLDDVDREAAQRARERYACFDQFGRDPQVYAYEAGIAGAEPCEQQAVQQLVELQAMTRRNGYTDPDGQFCDQGPSYATAVFASRAQKAAAEASRRAAAARIGAARFVTPVRDAVRFWPAEAHHQDFARRNPVRYAGYSRFCRRGERLRAVWGDTAA